MNLKSVIIAGVGFTFFGLNAAIAQETIYMAAPTTKPVALTESNPSKVQIEGLLSNLKAEQVAGSDLSGYALKAVSYMNEDIKAVAAKLGTTTTANTKIESKKAILKKAEALSAKFNTGKESKKELITDLLEQYLKTM